MAKSLQRLRKSKISRITLLRLLACLTVTRRMASAKDWMKRLQTKTNSMWAKLESHPNNDGPVAGQFDRPIRIAIIDTGAAIGNSDLEYRYDNRLIECRTWIGEEPGRLVEYTTSDSTGHGTHATSLALGVTENTDCEVYVAQCFEKPPQQKLVLEKDSEATAEAIALVSLQDERLMSLSLSSPKAIEYAVQHWKVDIISLSFGTDRAVDIIEDVIDEQAHKVLFFAAASTWGGNEPRVSWPARHDSIISMCASDGHGNSYRRNPNPRQNHYNLSVLGTAVSGLWPQRLQPSSSSYKKYKSGTSCATPFGDVGGANIFTLLGLQATLELLQVPEGEREHAVQATERLMRKLRQGWVMRQVMFEIGAKSIERQGYHYVAPWHIFAGSPEVAFNRVKDVVNAL
jgi:hypothetical protein